MKDTHFFRKGDKVRIKTLDDLITEWDAYQSLRIADDEVVAYIPGRTVKLFQRGQETNYGGKMGVVTYAGYMEQVFVKMDDCEEPIEFSVYVLELVEEKEELLELPSLPNEFLRSMETLKEVMSQFNNIEELVEQAQEIVRTLDKPTQNDAYLRGYREGLNEGRKRAFEQMAEFIYDELDVIKLEEEGEM